jgi:putative phosphoribosyl transferase
MFEDRSEAGRKLAEKLSGQNLQNSIVIMAIPRGGVPIGFEVARKLNVPLDVLVVRKLGAPFQPELGIGAIAPGNIRVLDQEIINDLDISQDEIEKIERKECQELERRIKVYRGTDSTADVNGKTVILVDDGLATGVSALAAIRAVLKQNPHHLIVAVPVCAGDVIARIRSAVRPGKDEVICLTTPKNLSAVGLWYKNFDQVSDQEVINLLRQSQSDT